MLEILKNRFMDNMNLHPELQWADVENRLREKPDVMEVLRKMEKSGGEPDTIGFDKETGKLIFCDCAKESPSGRRSLCYDDEAFQKRTKNPPIGSAEKKAQRSFAVDRRTLLQAASPWRLRLKNFFLDQYPGRNQKTGRSPFLRKALRDCIHVS